MSNLGLAAGPLLELLLVRGVSLDAELHFLEPPLPQDHLGDLSVLDVPEEPVERRAVDRLRVLLAHLRWELLVPLDLNENSHHVNEIIVIVDLIRSPYLVVFNKNHDVTFSIPARGADHLNRENKVMPGRGGLFRKSRTICGRMSSSRNFSNWPEAPSLESSWSSPRRFWHFTLAAVKGMRK